MTKRTTRKATTRKASDKATTATTATTADFEAVLGKHTVPAVPAATSAPLPKCAAGRIQRGRPHPSLLYVIESKSAHHPGRAHRIKRWHHYTVGMSLLHCRITEGLDHLDIGYYTRNTGTDGKPLMTIRPMSDDERKSALKRWEGEAVGEQPAVGTKPEGGTMNASDAAQ